MDGTVERDPRIDAWLEQQAGELGGSRGSGSRRCAGAATKCGRRCMMDVRRRAWAMWRLATWRFQGACECWILSRVGAAGSGGIAGGQREVHASCEAEAGSGGRWGGAASTDRGGVGGCEEPGGARVGRGVAGLLVVREFIDTNLTRCFIPNLCLLFDQSWRARVPDNSCL